MIGELKLKTMKDGMIDMRDLSMCIERAVGEIKAQGIPEERQSRLTDIGMTSINTVMLSFALELALKGALQREDKKPDRTHNLSDLYGCLTNESQERIVKEWREQLFLSKETKDIGPCYFFSLHQEDFANWRYLKSPKMEFRDHDMNAAIMAVNAASLKE